MNAWQLMFLQSKANDNPYNGDGLAIHNWTWPQGTWFQKRLQQLRRKRSQTHHEVTALLKGDKSIERAAGRFYRLCKI